MQLASAFPLPLPSVRSSVGAAELGGPTPAAFYATATGAVGVVSHARGKPLTRNGAPMQPKPNATPVCLELLDEHGAPTWLSRWVGVGCPGGRAADYAAHAPPHPPTSGLRVWGPDEELRV